MKLMLCISDENNQLIKKKRNNSKKELNTPKPAMNWSDMLPPPPEHPPPSECGDPPTYNEIRGDSRSNTRSPMSPAFSQLSACSCPNPHTQTPVSGWNMPMYSDNECPRCHSEKYYDPMSYCQDAFIRRTNSPRSQMMHHINSRNNLQSASGQHACSPRATPCANVHCQYSQPQRGMNPQNCAMPPQMMGATNNSGSGSNKSNNNNINRASHSSRSDNESPSIMPCLQSYRITPKEAVMEKDPRYGHEEWGPDPAPPCSLSCEHDSGMGLEEDGTCMNRACQVVQHGRAPAEYK